MSRWFGVCRLLLETDCCNNKDPSSPNLFYCIYFIQGGSNLFIFHVALLLFEHLLFCFMDWIQLSAPLILKAFIRPRPLIPRSCRTCAQFITTVSANSDASYSIDKSVFMTVHFLFSYYPIDGHSTCPRV